MTSNRYDVIIAGSGVAGLSSSIYTARGGNKTLVVRGKEPGGQLTWTTDVANYPGFPESVGGTELIDRIEEQTSKFGTEFTNGYIDSIEKNDNIFSVQLNSGEVLKSKSFICATGSSARKLGIPGESDLMGYGVSTCATCDGAFFRGEDMIVIGGGDSAFEESLYLTEFADTVYIVHRRENFRAEEYLQTKVTDKVDSGDIEIVKNTEVTKINGSKEDGVSNVQLIHNPKGYPRDKKEEDSTSTYTKEVGAVFLAIGHTPNTEFLKGIDVQLDERGYVIPDDATTIPKTATELDGLFVAGDVSDTNYQQAATASGLGVMAGMDANQYLESLSI